MIISCKQSYHPMRHFRHCWGTVHKTGWTNKVSLLFIVLLVDNTYPNNFFPIEKNEKKILADLRLTRGWLEIYSWLEVDSGSRLTHGTCWLSCRFSILVDWTCRKTLRARQEPANSNHIWHWVGIKPRPLRSYPTCSSFTCQQAYMYISIHLLLCFSGMYTAPKFVPLS